MGPNYFSSHHLLHFPKTTSLSSGWESLWLHLMLTLSTLSCFLLGSDFFAFVSKNNDSLKFESELSDSIIMSILDKNNLCHGQGALFHESLIHQNQNAPSLDKKVLKYHHMNSIQIRTFTKKKVTPSSKYFYDCDPTPEYSPKLKSAQCNLQAFSKKSKSKTQLKLKPSKIEWFVVEQQYSSFSIFCPIHNNQSSKEDWLWRIAVLFQLSQSSVLAKSSVKQSIPIIK